MQDYIKMVSNPIVNPNEGNNAPLNINSADANNVVIPQPTIADPDESFGDIINSVMKESGLIK